MKRNKSSKRVVWRIYSSLVSLFRGKNFSANAMLLSLSRVAIALPKWVYALRICRIHIIVFGKLKVLFIYPNRADVAFVAYRVCIYLDV